DEDVARVGRHPDRLVVDRDRGRPEHPDRHRAHLVRRRVDPPDVLALAVPDPDRTGAVADLLRGDADLDHGDDLVRRRVDAPDTALDDARAPDRARAERDVPELAA